jgi:PH-interacting protein
MTSSGRRVKRRNLDGCDGNSLKCNRTRKSRNGRKSSKRKSSKSKSLRPQRAAARNALNLFSKITGTSTDGEDEDGSENLSESESSLQDSAIDSDESDKSLQTEQIKHSKGKGVSLDESDDVVELYEPPESLISSGNRKRLVLKLPIRDSNKLVLPGSTLHYQAELVGSSSKAPQEVIEENGDHKSSRDPGYGSADADCSSVERKGGRRFDKVEDHLDLSEIYNNGQIRWGWGGVKARTSKRLRVGEATSSDAYARSHVLVGDDEKENHVDGHIRSQKDCETISPCLEMQNYGDNMDGVPLANSKYIVGSTSEGFNCESPKSVHLVAQETTSLQYKNGTDQHAEQNDMVTPIATKLRIRSTRTLRDPESPPKQEMRFSVQNNGRHESPSGKEQDPVAPEDDGSSRINTDHGDEAQESDTQIDNNLLSIVHDSQELHSNTNKMYTAVYKRSKSLRTRANLDVDSGGMGESTSNASNHNLIVGMDTQEGFIDGARRTRSMGLKASTCDSDTVGDSLKSEQGHELGYTLRNTHNSSMDRCQLPCEKWGSNSRMRSTRNRRSTNYMRDRSPTGRTKSHHSGRKGLWLLLSTHEEGSRYIPQQGDEVVYLRQVSC